MKFRYMTKEEREENHCIIRNELVTAHTRSFVMNGEYDLLDEDFNLRETIAISGAMDITGLSFEELQILYKAGEIERKAEAEFEQQKIQREYREKLNHAKKILDKYGS